MLHACIIYKIQKHFQNVMLVGMASEISKNYTYKRMDRSRHNGIKGAKAKCANLHLHSQYCVVDLHI